METGSLMSVKMNVRDIVIPSEERHIRMYPMDFEEFLWAGDAQKSNGLFQAVHDSWRHASGSSGI